MNDVTREYLRTGFKRWIRWIALAAVFAVACGFLANWQWNRRVQVLQVISRVNSNYNQKSVPLEQLLSKLSGFNTANQYRPVLVSGHYLTDGQLLLRNQVSDGNPGFHQLVPFALDSGRVITVDRGWVSIGQKQDLPDKEPTIQDGEIQLVGRLMPAQPADSRKAPLWQAMSITPKILNQQWSLPKGVLYTDAYLNLAVESPAPAGGYPVLATQPDITEGNHLSYAFQWVLFALLAFLAIGANIRQDIIEKRVAEEPGYVAPVRKRKKVGQADAEAEDALLTERDQV